MKGTREIFADAIGEIRLLGGMARIDLISLDTGEEPKSKPVPMSRGANHHAAGGIPAILRHYAEAHRSVTGERGC